MAKVDVIEELSQRNDRFRDNYRLLIKAAVFLLMTALVLTLSFAYLCLRPADPRYFASTATGHNIPLNSLNEPTVTDDFIVQWAGLAARNTLNVNYSHLDSDMNAAEPYYTPDGWQSLQAAMKNTNFLKNIQDNKLISTAVVNGSPVILDEAVIGGHYTWSVQVPVLVTYTSGNQTEQHKYVLSMLIERVSTLETDQGILINNIASLAPMLADQQREDSTAGKQDQLGGMI